MRALLIPLALLMATPVWATYPVSARVTVRGDDLSLADLVPDAPPAWAEVALGPAPRPGRTRTVSAAWVRRRADSIGVADELDLPGRVVVERPGVKVERDQVVAAVREALGERLGSGEQVRFKAVGLPAIVPDGRVSLEVRVPRGALPSPTTLWVEVEVDGVRRSRAWARVEIVRSRPVLVVTRTVTRGEVLGADDLEVRAGDGAGGALTDPDQALGRRAVRTLRAGRAVRSRDVEIVPVIGRGDTVRVVARIGTVTATTLGRSLGKAGIGEALRVENLSSGRTVMGTVREDGVVVVTLDTGRNGR